jgi:hypothetical protein
VYVLFGPHLHPPIPYSGFWAEPLFLQFCWRENIRDNKKDSVFASLR